MQTIVKFIPRNHGGNGRDGTYPLSTRTMGKMGLIDVNWRHPEGTEPPKSEEFWMVDIARETKPGTNRGCFILRPKRKVDIDNVHRLIPGLYHETRPNDSTLVATPKDLGKGTLWMMPLQLKRELMAKLGLSAVVVNLGGDLWYYGSQMIVVPEHKEEAQEEPTSGG